MPAQNPSGAFSPVPTAVPPCASRDSRGQSATIRLALYSQVCAQAEASCPSVIGTASFNWVRPILMITAHSACWWRNSAASARKAGNNRPRNSSATTTCMAVGKVSFELCNRLT
jgi:hypothetical protein